MKGRKWLWAAVLAGMIAAAVPAGWAAPGDVDRLNGVELKDAVLSLKVVAGLPADGVTLDGDVNGDEAVGLAEAVFALRDVALSGQEPGESFTNSLGMTFVRIPAGTFMMGSPESELGSFGNERPRHEVTLTQDFYMMTTEVTQAQWRAVMGSDPPELYFKNCGDDCPVEGVSWDDIQNFISELKALEGKNYRLPTEAEWEYAARAGTTTAFYNGDITETDCGLDPNLDAIGWYCGNSDVTYSGCYDASSRGGPVCAGTHPVAQKQPNAWACTTCREMFRNWLKMITMMAMKGPQLMAVPGWIPPGPTTGSRAPDTGTAPRGTAAPPAGATSARRAGANSSGSGSPSPQVGRSAKQVQAGL